MPDVAFRWWLTFCRWCPEQRFEKRATESDAPTSPERSRVVHGSRRPFGYEPGGLLIREAEAEAIRLAYRTIMNGGSLREVARHWNKAGLLTPQKNQPWTGTVVSRTLKTPRLAGMRTYHGEVVRGPDGQPIEAEWPPILSQDEFAALGAVLADPARRTTPDVQFEAAAERGGPLRRLWFTDPVSYGFRPNRRAHDTIAEVHHFGSHGYRRASRFPSPAGSRLSPCGKGDGKRLSVLSQGHGANRGEDAALVRNSESIQQAHHALDDPSISVDGPRRLDGNHLHRVAERRRLAVPARTTQAPCCQGPGSCRRCARGGCRPGRPPR